MKSLRIIAWILIAMSMVLKLMHYPFSGPAIILGVLFLFIHAIIFLFRNAETNLPDTFFHLNISIWTIYWMIRFMFWPFSQIIFVISICATFTYIVLLGIHKFKVHLPQIALFIYIAGLTALSNTQGYYIYYFFNLNPVLNETTNLVNYKAWDKYSWFLYVAEKKQEALQANQNADYAVKKSIKMNTNNIDAYQFAFYIQQHKQNIKEGNWSDYTHP
jgi:hypothetical protein